MRNGVSQATSMQGQASPWPNHSSYRAQIIKRIESRTSFPVSLTHGRIHPCITIPYGFMVSDGKKLKIERYGCFVGKIIREVKHASTHKITPTKFVANTFSIMSFRSPGQRTQTYDHKCRISVNFSVFRV